MFDFPNAPIVGDVYTSGSASYTWDGISWNIATTPTAADYVLKAGDTMTGGLLVSGTNDLAADHRVVVNGTGEKVCFRMNGCEIRRTGEGNIELWTDNGGYSTTWGLKMIVDNPPHVEVRTLIIEGTIKGEVFIENRFRIQMHSWGVQFHMPADTDEFVFNLGGSNGGDVFKINSSSLRESETLRAEVVALRVELSALKSEVAQLQRRARS
jgi:hypothetical protein